MSSWRRVTTEGDMSWSSWRWLLEPLSWQSCHGSDGVLWDFQQLPRARSSESAFKQAVAPTPGGTHLLGPKPFHHVAGVSPMPAGQAEIGRAPHGHVADGALEGEAFADGTLRAPDLTPAVAAVHAELWRGETAKKRDTMSFLLQKRTALCKLRKMHSLWDSGGSYQTVLFQWQNPFDSLTQSYLYRGASAPQGQGAGRGCGRRLAL